MQASGITQAQTLQAGKLREPPMRVLGPEDGGERVAGGPDLRPVVLTNSFQVLQKISDLGVGQKRALWSTPQL